MQVQPNIRVDVQSLVLLNLGYYRQYIQLKTGKSSWPVFLHTFVITLGAHLFWQ